MKEIIPICICLLLITSSQATVITVDDDGPADYNNIQAAIDDSNDSDVIEVQSGVYTGEGNRDIDFLGKAITVRSTNPNDPNIVAGTVVDCQEDGCGFHFYSGEDTNSVLDGFTIKNGLVWGADGGGILIENSNPTIRNCIIYNNTAYFNMVTGGRGGGICCKNNGNAVITNCTIENNTSSGSGGGVRCQDSSPTLIRCTISDNSAV